MAEYAFKIDRIRSCYSETEGNCPFCFIAIKIGERHCSLSSCKCLTSKRPNDCPLVEVPTHGRLIDADDIQEVLRLVQALIMTEKLSDSEIRLVQKTLGAISEAINEIDAVLEASTESTEERE